MADAKNTNDTEPQPGDDRDPIAALRDTERNLEELQKERDGLFERLARVSADYQNSMKRAESNLAGAIELARGDLFRLFIPVLDHFDTALQSPTNSDDAKALAQGVKIVRDEMLKVLQHAGVERIDVGPGEPFDPHVHEALLRQPVGGVEPGCVSAMLQPGYVYKGRTLRPAKVAVAPE